MWNPAGASFEAACERAGVRAGTVAVIGGPDVFEMFMDRYDTFWLSLAPRVKLPGGQPCFPGVPRALAAGDFGRTRPRPPATAGSSTPPDGVSVTPWRRTAQTSP